MLDGRSGGSFQTSLRIFAGGLIGGAGMRAMLVLVLLVAFAQHFCFQQNGEGPTVEELVPEPAFAAPAVGVLPWTAGSDRKRFESPPPDAVLHGLRDEFLAIVAADELRGAAWKPRTSSAFWRPAARKPAALSSRSPPFSG